MANKTEGVRLLVQDVLRTMREPYGEDVIEDVFIEIETHPKWRQQYDDLVDKLTKDVVNQMGASYVKRITGLDTIKEVSATRTDLVRSYSKLQPVR